MAHMGTPESRQVCETIGYPAQRKRQEPSPSSPSEGSPKDQHQPQKKRSRKGNDEEEGQSPEDKMLANLDLKRYLRLDPQNCDIDKERQSVIESAILLAKSVAMAEPQLKLNRECRPNFYNPSMYPSAEFLHLLLHGTSCQISNTIVRSTALTEGTRILQKLHTLVLSRTFFNYIPATNRGDDFLSDQLHCPWPEEDTISHLC